MTDLAPIDEEPPEDPFAHENVLDLNVDPELGGRAPLDSRPLKITTEERLLGALLQDHAQAASVIGRVTGHEFDNQQLGGVFDGMVAAIAGGARLTASTVSERFPEWGVRGLTAADPFRWDDVDVLPWLAHEYADAVRSAYLRVEGDRALAAARLELRDSGEAPLTVLSRIRQHIGGLVDDGLSSTARIETLAEVLTMEQSYDWIIPGLLERGDRLILTGAEGGGKSTLLRQIALSAAAGIHPLGLFGIPERRVLIVDAENSRRQWSRTAAPMVAQLRNFGFATDPVTRVGLVTTPRLDLTQPADLAAVHRHVDEWRPDILMIGPLYRLVPHAITNDDHASPLLTALDGLRDRGLALLLEAHAGKSTDGDGDRNMAPRGSSALMGWPEFGFGLRPIKADPSMVSVVPWRGARDGDRVWPRHLRRGTRMAWEDADPRDPRP